MGAWSDFFLAEAGASAALTGLIFVGVSISLPKIVANAGLPSRALEAIVLLLSVLVISSLLLVPDLSWRTVGIEVIVVGGLTWAMTLVLQTRNWRRYTPATRIRFLRQVVITQSATTLAVIAGILTFLNGSSGLTWLVYGFLLCFLAAILDGWVLLVEINR